jgi:hypothetical protein
LNHTFQTLTPPPARKFAPVTKRDLYAFAKSNSGSTSGAKSAEEPAKAWVSQPDGVKSEAKGFWLPPERGGA